MNAMGGTIVTHYRGSDLVGFGWEAVKHTLTVRERAAFKSWLERNQDAGTTLMGDKKFPELKLASQIHDWRYVVKSITKREADQEFSDNMARLILAAPRNRRRQLRMARWQRNLGVRSWIARLVWST